MLLRISSAAILLMASACSSDDDTTRDAGQEDETPNDASAVEPDAESPDGEDEPGDGSSEPGDGSSEPGDGSSESDAGQGSGASCGGFIGAPCPEGEFCRIDGECGQADGSGTCQTIPSECSREQRPVCGCDDVTYANRCLAFMAGVGLRSDMACE